MRSRLVVAAAIVATVILGALTPRATADWTPITPTTAGCPEYPFTATRVDATTVRVVNPLIADWQVGDFRIDGTTYQWTLIRVVRDTKACHAWRARITATTTRDQIRYVWYGADGGWLEDGWKGVGR